MRLLLLAGTAAFLLAAPALAQSDPLRGRCEPAVAERHPVCASGEDLVWYFTVRQPGKEPGRSWPYASAPEAEEARASDQRLCQSVARFFGDRDCEKSYGPVFCAACGPGRAVAADVGAHLRMAMVLHEERMSRAASILWKGDRERAVWFDRTPGSVATEYMREIRSAMERADGLRDLLERTTDGGLRGIRARLGLALRSPRFASRVRGSATAWDQRERRFMRSIQPSVEQQLVASAWLSPPGNVAHSFEVRRERGRLVVVARSNVRGSVREIRQPVSVSEDGRIFLGDGALRDITLLADGSLQATWRDGSRSHLRPGVAPDWRVTRRSGPEPYRGRRLQATCEPPPCGAFP